MNSKSFGFYTLIVLFIFSILLVLFNTQLTSTIDNDNNNKITNENDFISSYLTIFDSNEIKKKKNPENTCIFTISSWNNYGFVKTFLRSVELQHPEIGCFAWFVADNPNPPNIDTREAIKSRIYDVYPKNWHLITLDKLQKVADYSLESLALRYDLVEFNTAIKPYAFQYIFQELNMQKALYFDNDIYITSRLDHILSLLNQFSFVITPHITAPYPDDGKHQTERNIMLAGIYNFGFLGLSLSESTNRYLNWWGERLRYYGFVDVAKGMHFDQNWGSFIPSYFDREDYYVLRDPKYNVAYWNLHYTGKYLSLTDDGNIIWDNNPNDHVVFIHFSGMSDLGTYNMYQISKHQNRYSLVDFPNLYHILKTYIAILEKNEAMAWRDIKYGYSTFDDLIPITEVMKDYYIKLSDPHNNNNEAILFRENVYENPFVTKINEKSKITFREWLIEGLHSYTVVPRGKAYLPELAYQIYKVRPDLKKNFPKIYESNNHLKFLDWFLGNGLLEIGGNNQLVNLFQQRKMEEDNYKLNFRFSKGMNIVGWFRGVFGIGEASRIIYNSLNNKLNLNANLLPMSLVSHEQFNDSVPISRYGEYPINLFILNPLSSLDVKNKYFANYWKDHYNIGYWIWDLENFPNQFSSMISLFDEIWTPSYIITEAIRRSTSKNNVPIITMPLGLDIKQNNKNDNKLYDINKKYFNIPENAFVFLTIFDYESILDRKNPLGVIKAFQNAFGKDENSDPNVYLVLKSINSNKNLAFVELEQQIIQLTSEHKNIIHINNVLHEDELNKLKSMTNCFISLHRAEAYGLALLEMLMLNKPVISTGYGGNMEYMSHIIDLMKDLLIRYNLVSISQNSIHGENSWVNENFIWAEPNIDDATNAMELVVKDYSKYLKNSQEIGKIIRSEFNSEKTGSLMKDRIEKIFSNLDIN